MINSPLQLLVLSNGHGEDMIAVRIIQALQQLSSPPDIFALPIVGEGRAYQKIDIPLIGKVRTMPSGGFIYMDSRELMRDIGGGLVQLTLNQIQSIRRWVSSQTKLGNHKAVLAVGDIVPLLLAAMSGADYAFVGTAKSEYYVRDTMGLLARKSKSAWWENFSGSIYHPWERWLMSRGRCRAVFPRDSLTTEILKKWSIPAVDVGNPMMDGLQTSLTSQQFYRPDAELEEMIRPLIVTLLPGSRAPEAYNNWEVIMIAVSALMASLRRPDSLFGAGGTMIFLGAIAPGLDCSILSQSLHIQGWRRCDQSPLPISDPDSLTFQQKNSYFILTQQAYNHCLYLGDVAIAMAGTATEQFIGLGKPAIAIPGHGPQYNPGFAEAQSRLLGISLTLVNQPSQVLPAIQSLLKNPDILHAIAENGIQRMGRAGAAQRIAECLQERLMGNG
ncbi:lipid-A-disaccharide synthase-related protein [Aphanizomenon sp. CS-733/32]|uniref:lipid-A-disaccharide synthase-related protein n=1 Tax=Aphanizomenon sp. CS-733/32 TaxID=3021715 RepID=UPI00232B7972|nr:lipid-A-disaccharide synthase-related protein [Aphanizomenon sp. CS-733/32]MDB9309645.1 lipid-A-disaccharide synthase-related protein [Aphanizomenon sp. CS-733/32]